VVDARKVGMNRLLISLTCLPKETLRLSLGRSLALEFELGADILKTAVVPTWNDIVRLEDVADVVLGAESYDEDVRFSGQKAVFMGVWGA
jgi:multidrug efflux pump subunit AcrB